MLLGDGKPLPFLRAHVKQNRTRRFFREFQIGFELRDVVPVDGAEITQLEILEQRRRSRRDDLLFFLLPRGAGADEVLAARELGDEATQPARGVVVKIRRDEPVEIVRHGADVAVDRPCVVVEHDDEPPRVRRDVVERFQRRAVGHGGVADDGDDVLVPAEAIPRGGDAERGGKRRSRVTAAEGVAFAFRAGTEAGNAVRLAQRVEALAAAREDFVRVALMRNVEDDAVARRVENAVERDRELDDAEVRRDVSAVFRGDGDDAFPQLARQLRQVLRRKLFQIRRAVNFLKHSRQKKSRVLLVERGRFRLAVGGDGAQLLDAQLGVRQFFPAAFQDRHALFVAFDELGERHVSAFEPLDDGFKPGKFFFKSRFLVALLRFAHGSCD